MARPKRKKIDQLRTKVWYEWLRDQLGLSTAYEMDDFFGSGTDRNWYKYRAGTRVPTHATLAAVERKCPGSRFVFEQGPNKVQLWVALAAPHIELWDVIDSTFPEYKEARNHGVLGIQQYGNFFERKLLPEEYKRGIDFIDYAKGLQRNAVYLAHTRGQITITPEIAASVIAFWRLSSLVFFNMLNVDYLLSGLMSVLHDGNVFGSRIDNHLWRYLNDNLREEYSVSKIDKMK